MMAYTSNITIKRFGRKAIMNYYKHGFKLDYLLGKLSNVTTDSGTWVLTFAGASIQATRRKVMIRCIAEGQGDSVKLVLERLDHPFE